MLPRSDRAHDQLLNAVRAETVWATVGGALVGYVAWLLAISVGAAVATVSTWSLIVLVLSAVLAIWASLWGRRLRRRRNYPLAGFAFGLPVLPVVLTLGVLAATYL
jgi:divalent metal cation (Fe/Co/Zn/Cd) transporter